MIGGLQAAARRDGIKAFAGKLGRGYRPVTAATEAGQDKGQGENAVAELSADVGSRQGESEGGEDPSVGQQDKDKQDVPAVCRDAVGRFSTCSDEHTANEGAGR